MMGLKLKQRYKFNMSCKRRVLKCYILETLILYKTFNLFVCFILRLFQTVFQSYRRAVSLPSFLESYTSTRLPFSVPNYRSISRESNPRQRGNWIRSHRLQPFDHGGGPKHLKWDNWELSGVQITVGKMVILTGIISTN
jgi:hypothetical protein